MGAFLTLSLLFIAGIVAGAVGLILLIIGAVQKKQPLIISGVVCFVIAAALVVTFTVRSYQTAREVAGDLTQAGSEFNERNFRNRNIKRKGEQALEKSAEIAKDAAKLPMEVLWTDKRPYLITENHPLTRELMAYTPDANAPDEFYTYFGFRDWWRLPLVYPYSLFITDDLDNAAQLSNDKDIADFGNYDANTLNTPTIRSFTFDKQLLLAQAADSEGYFIYNFKTGETIKFPSREAMMEKAREMDFTEVHNWMTPREYNEKF